MFDQTNLYVETGSGDNLRTLDIAAISSKLGKSNCKVMPALHAFTGNDYTSAFHGIGKVKALKIIVQSKKIRRAFKRIGDTFDFNAKHFSTVEEFVCLLYGAKGCTDVNEARYIKFFSSKNGSAEPQKLPPTRDALLQHCKRVSYVTAIIKRALENNPTIPNPDGHGWSKTGDSLSIEWMLLPPAPPQILEQISCGCQKGCKTMACRCQSHGLTCTEFCRCKDCINTGNVDNIVQDTDDEREREEEIDDKDQFDEEEELDDTNVDFCLQAERFENLLKAVE